MFNLFKKKPKFYSAKILNKDKEFKVSKGKPSCGSIRQWY